MAFYQLLITGAALSMDAFAASVCRGLGMRRIRWFRVSMIALFFGGFQALMPVIGWLLGRRFLSLISPVDHWVAFLLLAVIGVKMIADSIKDRKKAADTADDDQPFGYGGLLLMAVATSIDALAVGLTLGVLGVRIGLAALTIGGVTFLLSFSGACIGFYFGGKIRGAAGIAGGAALFLIGLQILLQHIGVPG